MYKPSFEQLQQMQTGYPQGARFGEGDDFAQLQAQTNAQYAPGTFKVIGDVNKGGYVMDINPATGQYERMVTIKNPSLQGPGQDGQARTDGFKAVFQSEFPQYQAQGWQQYDPSQNNLSGGFGEFLGKALLGAGMAGIGGLGMGLWGPGAGGISGGSSIADIASSAANTGGGGMDWSQLLGGDYGGSIADIAANAAGGAGYDPAMFQGLAEGVSPGMTDWSQYFGTSGLNTTGTPSGLDFMSNIPTDSVMAGSGAGGAGSSNSILQQLKSFLQTPEGSALGRAVPGLIGALAASQQGNANSDLAKQFMEFGAPSRARYEGSFQPGFTMMNDPGYKDALDSTSQGILAKLSATGGNPFGNPAGLMEANKQINAGLALPALQNYRNQNAATGGFNAFNTAAPSAMASSAQSGGDVWNALGSAAQSAFNPQKSLADQLREISGLKFGGNSF